MNQYETLTWFKTFYQTGGFPENITVCYNRHLITMEKECEIFRKFLDYWIYSTDSGYYGIYTSTLPCFTSIGSVIAVEELDENLQGKVNTSVADIIQPGLWGLIREGMISILKDNEYINLIFDMELESSYLFINELNTHFPDLLNSDKYHIQLMNTQRVQAKG